jgi:hypothetical protein
MKNLDPIEKKLNELENAAKPDIITVWTYDDTTGNRTRHASNGELITLTAAEWEEHVKNSGETVITIVYDENWGS